MPEHKNQELKPFDKNSKSERLRRLREGLNHYMDHYDIENCLRCKNNAMALELTNKKLNDEFSVNDTWSGGWRL